MSKDDKKTEPALVLTPQEAALEGLMKDLLTKLDGRFSDLEAKVQNKFLAAVQDIEKLADKAVDEKAAAEKRFRALADHYRRGGAYKGPFADAEEAAHFGRFCVRALLGPEALPKEQAEKLQQAAIGVTTGEKGGYLVPESLMDGIIYNVEQYGLAERELDWVPTDQSAGAVKFTQGATVYYPDEGVAPTESNFKFASVKFNLTRYSAYALADRWMLRTNAFIAIGDFIAGEMARAMAYAQDLNLFMGDGTSTYARTIGAFNRAGTNQLKVTADTGDNTFAEVCDASVKYLGSVIGTCPEWIEQWSPAFYMHRTIFWRYMSARDSQNRPIADVRIGASGKPEQQLFGYPVRITQVAPKLSDSGNSKKLLLFGALRKGFRGARHRAGAELRVSEHLKFLEGQIGMVLDLPQCIEEIDNQAYCQLETAAS